MSALVRRWAALIGALALAACAQGGPPPAGEPARGSGAAPTANAGLGSMASAAAARKWLLDQSASRLADTQRQLRLTPAQVPAWDRFAASVGELVTDLSRFETDPLNVSALQRVNRRVDIARNRYTALESVADSMSGLYAVLTEEQRALADRLLAAAVPSLYEGNPFSIAPDPGRGPSAIDAAARRPSRGDAPRAP